MKKEKIHLVWFKKDLRIFDNEAIFKAAKSNRRILFFYIFEDKIITLLKSKMKLSVKNLNSKEAEKIISDFNNGTSAKLMSNKVKSSAKNKVKTKK